MVLVGLTGGIGAGKSTVARLLADRGAVLVDADVIARSVVEPGQPALEALAARFGPAVIRADGTLDRQALADLAFASEDGTQALNEITWPAIRAEMRHQVDAAPRDAVVVVDAALLLDAAFGLPGGYDAIVVVEAPVDVRLERLQHRGLQRADAARRIAAQISDEDRRERATHIIDNGGALEALVPRVDALWEELRTPD